MSCSLDADNHEGFKQKNPRGPVETLADLWAAVGCRSHWRTPILPAASQTKALAVA